MKNRTKKNGIATKGVAVLLGTLFLLYLDLAPVEILSDRLRRMAFDSMRSLTAAALCSSSVVGIQLVLRLAQVDGDALEIEACAGLLAVLVEGVAQLLLVEVADDVE